MLKKKKIRSRGGEYIELQTRRLQKVNDITGSMSIECEKEEEKEDAGVCERKKVEKDEEGGKSNVSESDVPPRRSRARCCPDPVPVLVIVPDLDL